MGLFRCQLINVRSDHCCTNLAGESSFVREQPSCSTKLTPAQRFKSTAGRLHHSLGRLENGKPVTRRVLPTTLYGTYRSICSRCSRLATSCREIFTTCSISRKNQTSAIRYGRPMMSTSRFQKLVLMYIIPLLPDRARMLRPSIGGWDGVTT